jgi:hypothetical protein
MLIKSVMQVIPCFQQQDIIYIYRHYTSARVMNPLIYHPDQVTEPATAPRAHNRDRAPCDRLPRGSEPARPALTPRGRVDPGPHCPSHAPIEPTDLARPRPRVTQSFFVVRSTNFDKA